MNRRLATTEIGREAERLSAEWLKTKGFEIIECNWRTRFHEIDIIAKRGQNLHFVEVKYRRCHNYGWPAEFVDFRKQRRIRAAAFAYLNSKRPVYGAIQIDVIGVYGLVKPYKLRYIPNITMS